MKNLMRLVILSFLSLLMVYCIEGKSSKINETPNTFTLNAELEGLTSDYLVYSEKNDNYPSGYRMDTLWVKDQKFTFTDSVDTYKLYFITVPEAVREFKQLIGGKEYTLSTKANVCRLWFIGYPGAEIEYKGKVANYMVDAYPHDSINDDLAFINSKVFPLQNAMNAISVDQSIKNLDQAERQILSDSSNKLYEKIRDLKHDFIKSHTGSLAASYVFNDAYYRNYYSQEEAEALFKNFDSTKLSGTPFYDEIKQRLDAVKKTGIGMQAPELTTTHTLDGSEFKLSSLRGNYVLLDFWGTWCGPCMGEMPRIKDYYNKYSDKNFVVLGVNSGDTTDRWKNAIEENGFNWRHIQTTKDNDLLIPFDVNSFPTKILLDPNGKIIYSSKNTEEKIDLYQMIDNIFTTS